MPHKRNPIGSENITGCARLLRGYMVAAYENVALWHERDISHSSVERVIIPDASTVLDYALQRFATIMERLVVYPATMRENMERTFGLFNSQRLLIKLIDAGSSREAAYDLVQPLAMRAWEEKRSFRDIVEEDGRVGAIIGPDEVKNAFDAEYHLRNVDAIFDRVGLA